MVVEPRVGIGECGEEFVILGLQVGNRALRILERIVRFEPLGLRLSPPGDYCCCGVISSLFGSKPRAARRPRRSWSVCGGIVGVRFGDVRALESVGMLGDFVPHAHVAWQVQRCNGVQLSCGEYWLAVVVSAARRGAERAQAQQGGDDPGLHVIAILPDIYRECCRDPRAPAVRLPLNFQIARAPVAAGSRSNAIRLCFAAPAVAPITFNTTPGSFSMPPEITLSQAAGAVPAPSQAAAQRGEPAGIVQSLLRGFMLEDILSTRHHSDDFIETRAEYILLRLRFMVIFYAVVVPLWIPFDYFLVSAEHFTPILFARFALSSFLSLLGMYTLRKLSSRQVHWALMLAIVGPCLFYAGAMLIFAHGQAEPVLAGYSFMPFLVIAMLGVFPLTLAWGAGLVASVVLIQLGLSAVQGQLFTRGTLDTLWVFMLFGGITLWIQAGQLLMLLKLYRESTQDPLTGLINRRVLMKRLDSEIARAGEPGRGFCILMFDLDRFKRINDTHGHLTGDVVLRTTARVLREGLRGGDLLARFGGEEFVAVLPGTRSVEAVALAERIRQCCYDTPVTAPNGERVQLSTSVGVTEFEPGEAIEVTLNRVDDSLYKAKELGRNRVIHSQSNSAAHAS